MHDHRPWFSRSGAECASALWEHMSKLAGWRERRASQINRLEYLYSREYDADTFSDWGSLFQDVLATEQATLPRLNLYKGAIDTVASRLGRNIPAIQTRPAGAPYERRHAAERLTQALNGTLNRKSARAVIQLWFRAAATTGCEWIRPVIEGNDLVYEHYRWRDVWYSYRDAQRGKPRALHLLHRMDRGQLLAKLEGIEDLGVTECDDGKERPMSRDLILEAIEHMRPAGASDLVKATSQGLYEMRLSGSHSEEDLCGVDEVHVIETTRLPSGPDKDDGFVMWTVHGGLSGPRGIHSDVVALRKPWRSPSHSLVNLRPYPLFEGIDGLGLGHALRSPQEQVDQMVGRAQSQINQLAHTRILIQEGMTKSKEDLAAPDVTFIEVPAGAGMQAPQVLAPNPVSAQTVEFIDRYINWAYQFSGVSNMQAAGQSQAGAGASGVARMVEWDKETDRHSDFEDQIGLSMLALAAATLDVLDHHLDWDPDFRASWLTDTHQSRDDRAPRWSDLRMPKEHYFLELEPVSELGTTPAARYNRIAEMAEKGHVDPGLAQDELARVPDMESTLRYVTAPRRLWERKIVSVVEDAEPDELAIDSHLLPYLDQGAEMVTRELCDAEALGSSQDTIARLHSFLQAIEDLKRDSAEDAAAAAPPQPPMDPMAMGGGMSPGMPMDPGMGGAMPGMPPGPPMIG